MFSNAMLAVVSTIVLKLSIIVAAASLGPDVVQAIINGITNFFINSSPTAPDAAQNVVFAGTGLVHQAMTVGGIGLMLSTLVLVIPPIAGRFFSETLGSMSPYSVFGGVGAWGGTKGGGGYDPAKGGYNSVAGSHDKDNGRGHTNIAGTPPDPTNSNKSMPSTTNLGGANQSSTFNTTPKSDLYPSSGYDKYINNLTGNSASSNPSTNLGSSSNQAGSTNTAAAPSSTNKASSTPNPINPTNKD